MRKWRCTKTKCNSYMKVGSIVETDNNGYGLKWLDGAISRSAKIEAYKECGYEFVEIFVKNDFTKSDLQDGDIIVCRNSYRLVYFNKKFMDGNMVNTELTIYEDNLIRRTFPNKMPEFDVMQVYRNNELIFERIEKTEKQIELEKLKENIKELEKRIEEMEKENL